MPKQNFQPIYDYFDHEFRLMHNYIEHRFDEFRVEMREAMATKDDVRRILELLDAATKRHNELDEEQIILKYKSGQMEGWVVRAAEKIELPYTV